MSHNKPHLSHACATSRNQCENKIKTVVACTDRNVPDWTNKHCDRLDVVEMLASHSPIKRFTLCRRKNERPNKAKRCQEVSYERTRACATRKQSKPFESRSLAMKFDFTRNKSRHLIRERRCDPDWRVSGSRRHTDRDHTHATSYTGST